MIFINAVAKPKLSDLNIDADKDWAAKKIENLGAPDSLNDALRRRASMADLPDGLDEQYLAGLEPSCETTEIVLAVVTWNLLGGSSFTLNATTWTEGVDFNAAASNAQTATNIAAAVDAIAGFSASATNEYVTITCTSDITIRLFSDPAGWLFMFNKIKVKTGTCMAQDHTTGNWDYVINVDSEIIIDRAVSGAGGLEENDTWAANKWYDMYLIAKSSDGTINTLFNESGTSIGTMPAGYDKERHIGFVRSRGDEYISAFVQVGNWLMWDTGIANTRIIDDSVVLPAVWTDIDASAALPPVDCMCFARLVVINTAAAADFFARGKKTTVMEQVTCNISATGATAVGNHNSVQFLVSSDQVVQYKVGAATRVIIDILGFYYA